MASVLIVDDERNIREFCRKEFERDGHFVMLAADGEHALEIVESDLPDLVITDVQMEKMDGFALADQIRERCLETTVIFHTGLRDIACLKFQPPVMGAAFKNGDLAELKALVAKCLQRKSIGTHETS